MPNHRPRRLRHALVATFMLVGLLAPTATQAQGGQIELSLRPLGQAGSFFDLTMAPGEIASLDVRIANTGDAAVVARTYAADVYTIINGGFGGRLRDEARTGMTDWLDYETDILSLASGMRIERTFTITVPTDAGPGEYITSLVLENDRPIKGSGPVSVNQIVRQAVAVVVTVPGVRSPALTIGRATHKVVAGKSIVSTAVDNPGNVRLKPLVEVVLLDEDGAVVGEATVQMDTFYARTDTYVEVPLDALLQPGRYTVRVAIDDASENVAAKADDLGFVVDAPAATPGVEGGTGLTAVFQTIGKGQLPVWAFILFAGVVLGAVVVGLIGFAMWRRRRTRTAGRR